jgi:phosphate transport system permease protein
MTNRNRDTVAVRRRIDAIFGNFVRISVWGPLFLVVFMMLTLVDWSMGTVLMEDGRIVRHWRLSESVIGASDIREEIADMEGNVSRSFRFWLNPGFITGNPSSSPQETGLRAGLAGSLWIISIGLAVSFPTALATALWLDRAQHHAWFARILQTALSLFNRMPHIIFGLCAMALFSRISGMGRFSGSRTVGHAGLLMGLIMIPKLALMMEEQLAATPDSIKHASYALGASWQAVVFRQILPTSIELIFIGTVKIIAGLLGLASPFIVLGAASFVVASPSSMRDHFITLPIQIFQWALRPDGIYRSLAASAALFMALIVFVLSMAAFIWRKRVLRRREGLR